MKFFDSDESESCLFIFIFFFKENLDVQLTQLCIGLELQMWGTVLLQQSLDTIEHSHNGAGLIERSVGRSAPVPPNSKYTLQIVLMKPRVKSSERTVNQAPW